MNFFGPLSNIDKPTMFGYFGPKRAIFGSTPAMDSFFSKKPLFVTKTFSFRENLHFDNLKRVCTIFGINRDREAVSGCSKTIWRRLALKRALDFERSIGSEVKQTGPHPILEILQGFPSHSV